MTEAWITFNDDRKNSTVRNSGYLRVIARLQEGVGQAEAQEEVWEGTSHVALATPVYFQAMGIPLLSGRSLSEDDLRSSELVRGMLFEVSPTNPAALAAAGILLTVAVLAASLIPARRAAGFDPVEILKGD